MSTTFKPAYLDDSILQGFIIEDVIMTVNCNEPVINETIVRKVFDEMLTHAIVNARELLKQNMQVILDDLKEIQETY